MKRSLFWMLGLLAFIGALWGGWRFRSGNAGQIDLDLIFLRLPEVEIWWAMLVTLAAGVLFTLVLMGFVWLRMRLLLRRYRASIRRLEKEVHELRSLPLHASEPVTTDFASAESEPGIEGASLGRG